MKFRFSGEGARVKRKPGRVREGKNVYNFLGWLIGESLNC